MAGISQIARWDGATWINVADVISGPFKVLGTLTTNGQDEQIRITRSTSSALASVGYYWGTDIEGVGGTRHGWHGLDVLGDMYFVADTGFNTQIHGNGSKVRLDSAGLFLYTGANIVIGDAQTTGRRLRLHYPGTGEIHYLDFAGPTPGSERLTIRRGTSPAIDILPTSVTIFGDLNMNSNLIVGVLDPTNAGHAANKSYVDGDKAALTFNNSFANNAGSFAAAEVHRVGKHVWMTGLIKNNHATNSFSSGTMATVPSGYTPYSQHVTTQVVQVGGLCRVDISVAGLVTLSTQIPVTLAPGQFISINAHWPIT